MPDPIESPATQDEITLLSTDPSGEETPAEETPAEETPETPAEETPAEETPAEETLAEEEPKEEEEEEPGKKPAAEEEDETLEELEGEEIRDKTTGKPVTIGQALQSAYKQYPQLKEFLSKPENKELRYDFFRSMEMGKVFPTVREAKMAREQAGTLDKLDTLYYGDTEDKKQFIHNLWENSLDKDTGKSDGHFEEVQLLMTQYYLEDVIQKALTDEGIAEIAKEMNLEPKQVHLAAIIMGKIAGVDGVDSLIQAGSKGSVKGPVETPASRRQAVERKRFEEERSQFERERQTEYETGVRKQFDSFMQTEIGQILDRVSGLEAKVNGKPANAGLRRMVTKEILSAVDKQIRDDAGFLSRIAKTLRSGNRSPERAEQALRDLKVRGRATLRAVVRETLADLGYSMMRQEAAKQERTAAGARRREPAGGGAPGGEKASPTGGAQPKKGESYQDFANRVLMPNA